jgi:hypothetical protein
MEHGATVASLVGFQQSIGQIVAAKAAPNLGLLHILKKNSKYATSMIVDHTVSILILFLNDIYLMKLQLTKTSFFYKIKLIYFVSTNKNNKINSLFLALNAEEYCYNQNATCDSSKFRIQIF